MTTASITPHVMTCQEVAGARRPCPAARSSALRLWLCSRIVGLVHVRDATGSDAVHLRDRHAPGEDVMLRQRRDQDERPGGHLHGCLTLAAGAHADYEGPLDHRDVLLDRVLVRRQRVAVRPPETQGEGGGL